MTLDTLAGCMNELESLNAEIHKFEHEWAAASGELKKLIRQRERVLGVALIALRDSGLTVAERAAKAQIAVLEAEASKDLEPRIDDLEELAEKYKTRFRALDRLSSNAQSVMKAHMERPGRE